MKTQIAHVEERTINRNEGGLKTHVGIYRVTLIAFLVIAAAFALSWAGMTGLRQPSNRQVAVQSIIPLPFGPGWAADYGTNEESPAINQDLPFGPGWAADYGTAHNLPPKYQRLPFGPGLAATYGTRYSHALPFGPGWAATYGTQYSHALPFGPGLAATYGVPPR